MAAHRTSPDITEKELPVSTRGADDLDRLRALLVELSPAQAIAADALAAGSTHAEAAEAAGVARETVTRWVGCHPGFRATLDLYRTSLAIEHVDRVLRIRGKALNLVEQKLDDADLAGALAVLRFVPAPPAGPLASPISADDRLTNELRRLAANVRPPPPLRNTSGRIERGTGLDDIAYDTDAERTEYAERIAVERLAEAAGVINHSETVDDRGQGT
jgi:hypothetical protein